MGEFTFLIGFFILLIVTLCVILYLIGKLRSDIEYFINLSEKHNEFVQDRLYVLEVKLDNFESGNEEHMIFNTAPGKQ
jgi:hypothetical protein